MFCPLWKDTTNLSMSHRSRELSREREMTIEYEKALSYQISGIDTSSMDARPALYIMSLAALHTSCHCTCACTRASSRARIPSNELVTSTRPFPPLHKNPQISNLCRIFARQESCRYETPADSSVRAITFCCLGPIMYGNMQFWNIRTHAPRL